MYLGNQSASTPRGIFMQIGCFVTKVCHTLFVNFIKCVVVDKNVYSFWLAA